MCDNVNQAIVTVGNLQIPMYMDDSQPIHENVVVPPFGAKITLTVSTLYFTFVALQH
jgi:hypothetical protein